MKTRNMLWAAVSATLFLLAPTQAAYEDVEFTELLSDGGDQPIEFWDVVSVAAGEPGDGTLVLRGEVGAFSQPEDVMGTFFFGFAAAGVDILGGFMYDGTPDTRNIGEPIAPTSCTIDAEGAFGYCVWPYEDIGAQVGDELTRMWGFIDGCSVTGHCLPADTAPGGPAVDGWPAWEAGATYTLQGSTSTGGGGGGEGPGGSTIRWLELSRERAQINLTFEEPTSDTYNYNWTASSGDLVLMLDADVTEGTVEVGIRDADGNAAFSTTLSEGQQDEQDVSGTAGDWQISLRFDGFQGTLEVDLGPEQTTGGNTTTTTTGTGTGTGTTTSGTGTDTTTNGTTTDGVDEDSPGIGLLAVAAVMTVGIIAARRRL